VKRPVAARKQVADHIEKRQVATHKQAAIRKPAATHIGKDQGAAGSGIRQVATCSHNQLKAQDPGA
jgi:hypothetical protein